MGTDSLDISGVRRYCFSVWIHLSKEGDVSVRTILDHWNNDPEMATLLHRAGSSIETVASLQDSRESQDRITVKRLRQELNALYWTLASRLLENRASEEPERLTFDENERLFLDTGFLSEALAPAPEGAAEWIRQDAPLGLFQIYTFSDYLAELYSLVNDRPAPNDRSGYTALTRISAFERRLDAHRQRLQFFLNGVLAKCSGIRPDEVRALAEHLSSSIGGYTEVAMRTRNFRESEGDARQQMSVEHKQFHDAEIQLTILLRTAVEDGALDEAETKRVLAMLEAGKNCARDLVFIRRELSRWEFRTRKFRDAYAKEAQAARRVAMRTALETKKEYVELTAKSARLEPSPLCDKETKVVPLRTVGELLDKLSNADFGMFSVARVRMYGIPRVILVPGRGYGTYDWSDNTLLLPIMPNYSADRSISYALGTFRWDSDEDRDIKNGYELIPDNKGKSIVDLGQSFYKDYYLWLTKEQQGYRILPRHTHKAFLQIFAQKVEE